MKFKPSFEKIAKKVNDFLPGKEIEGRVFGINGDHVSIVSQVRTALMDRGIKLRSLGISATYGNNAKKGTFRIIKYR